MPPRLPHPLLVALGLGLADGCKTPPVPVGPCLSPPLVEPLPPPPPAPVPPDDVPVHPCLSLPAPPPPPPAPPEPAPKGRDLDGGASLDDVLERLPEDVASRLRRRER